MYYYYWLAVTLFYLCILTTYAILSLLIKNPDEPAGKGDTVFFAIASVVTLSIVPLMRESLYT